MIIYKYQLTNGSNTLQMPEHSNVLSVQLQHGMPTLWALIEKDDNLQPLVDRTFIIVTTNKSFIGNPMLLSYITTFQKDWFVGHVFEVLQSVPRSSPYPIVM